MVESSPVEPRTSVAIKSTYEMIEVLLNNKLPGTLGKTAHAISVLKEEHVALQEKFQDAYGLLEIAEAFFEEAEVCSANTCASCKNVAGLQRVLIRKFLNPKSMPEIVTYKKCPTCGEFGHCSYTIKECICNKFEKWVPRKGENN